MVKEMVNSVGNSILMDPSDFALTDQSFQIDNWNELVIYEMHLGTFPGGSPPDTFDQAITRLDHLVELGINAVELMPINEFAGGLSWGYNPGHVFAVEEAYGGLRGLQRFVNACHERGIAVLLDVVYNHLGPSDLGIWRFDGWSQGDWGGVYFYNDDRGATPWGNTRPDLVETKWGVPRASRCIQRGAHRWTPGGWHRLDPKNWCRSWRGDVQDNPDGWAAAVPTTVSMTKPRENHCCRRWLQRLGRRPTLGVSRLTASGTPIPLTAAGHRSGQRQRSNMYIRDAVNFAYNGDPIQQVLYTENRDEVTHGRSRVQTIWPGNAGRYYSRNAPRLAEPWS